MKSKENRHMRKNKGLSTRALAWLLVLLMTAGIFPSGAIAWAANDATGEPDAAIVMDVSAEEETAEPEDADQPEAEQADANITADESADAEPATAEETTSTLTTEADGRTISVSGNIPEGAELQVTAIPQDTFAEILEAAGDTDANAEGSNTNAGNSQTGNSQSSVQDSSTSAPDADSDGWITVSTNGSSAPAQGCDDCSALHVKLDADESTAAKDNHSRKSASNAAQAAEDAAEQDAFAYDISITVDGEKWQPADDGEEVTVTISDVDANSIIHIKADFTDEEGKLDDAKIAKTLADARIGEVEIETIPAQSMEDGIGFKTDSFSAYGYYDPSQSNNPAAMLYGATIDSTGIYSQDGAALFTQATVRSLFGAQDTAFADGVFEQVLAKITFEANNFNAQGTRNVSLGKDNASNFYTLWQINNNAMNGYAAIGRWNVFNYCGANEEFGLTQPAMLFYAYYDDPSSPSPHNSSSKTLHSVFYQLANADGNFHDGSTSPTEFILRNYTGDLSLSGQNITDINGIKYLANSRIIDLSNNQIRDISPIGSKKDGAPSEVAPVRYSLNLFDNPLEIVPEYLAPLVVSDSSSPLTIQDEYQVYPGAYIFGAPTLYYLAGEDEKAKITYDSGIFIKDQNGSYIPAFQTKDEEGLYVRYIKSNNTFSLTYEFSEAQYILNDTATNYTKGPAARLVDTNDKWFQPYYSDTKACPGADGPSTGVLSRSPGNNTTNYMFSSRVNIYGTVKISEEIKQHGTLEATKVSATNHGLPVAGAVYSLERLEKTWDAQTSTYKEAWVPVTERYVSADIEKSEKTALTPADLTTDQEGKIQINYLPNGQYRLKEINSPNGYKLDDSTYDISFVGPEFDSSVSTNTTGPGYLDPLEMHLQNSGLDGQQAVKWGAGQKKDAQKDAISKYSGTTGEIANNYESEKRPLPELGEQYSWINLSAGATNKITLNCPVIYKGNLGEDDYGIVESYYVYHDNGLAYTDEYVNDPNKNPYKQSITIPQNYHNWVDFDNKFGNELDITQDAYNTIVGKLDNNQALSKDEAENAINIFLLINESNNAYNFEIKREVTVVEKAPQTVGKTQDPNTNQFYITDEPIAVYIQPEVQKYLDGRMPTEGESFEFSISLTDSTPELDPGNELAFGKTNNGLSPIVNKLESKKNDGSKVTFDELAFNIPGTYDYEVKEVPESGTNEDNTIEYNTTIKEYPFYVLVKEIEGKGLYVFVYDEKDARDAAKTTLDGLINGIEQKRSSYDPDSKLTDEIKAYTDAVAALETLTAGNYTKDELDAARQKVEQAKDAYEEARKKLDDEQAKAIRDLLKDLWNTAENLKETALAGSSSNTESAHQVDHDSLIITPTTLGDFENETITYPVALKFKADKDYNGPQDKDEPFTFTLTPQGSAPSSTENGDAESITITWPDEKDATFGTIFFAKDKNGSFTYTLEERKGENGFITYDSTAHTITVVAQEIYGKDFSVAVFVDKDASAVEQARADYEAAFNEWQKQSKTKLSGFNSARADALDDYDTAVQDALDTLQKTIDRQTGEPTIPSVSDDPNNNQAYEDAIEKAYEQYKKAVEEAYRAYIGGEKQDKTDERYEDGLTKYEAEVKKQEALYLGMIAVTGPEGDIIYGQTLTENKDATKADIADDDIPVIAVKSIGGKSTFTNKTKTYPVNIKFKADKDFDGDGERTFTFELAPSGDTAGAIQKKTISWPTEKEVIFDTIEYASEGIYTYTLKELGKDEAGNKDADIDYDDTTHTVTVVVKEIDGEMRAKVFIDDKDDDAQKLSDALNFAGDKEVEAAKLALAAAEQAARDKAINAEDGNGKKAKDAYDSALKDAKDTYQKALEDARTAFREAYNTEKEAYEAAQKDYVNAQEAIKQAYEAKVKSLVDEFYDKAVTSIEGDYQKELKDAEDKFNTYSDVDNLSDADKKAPDAFGTAYRAYDKKVSDLIEDFAEQTLVAQVLQNITDTIDEYDSYDEFLGDFPAFKDVPEDDYENGYKETLKLMLETEDPFNGLFKDFVPGRGNTKTNNITTLSSLLDDLKSDIDAEKESYLAALPDARGAARTQAQETRDANLATARDERDPAIEHGNGLWPDGDSNNATYQGTVLTVDFGDALRDAQDALQVEAAKVEVAERALKEVVSDHINNVKPLIDKRFNTAAEEAKNTYDLAIKKIVAEDPAVIAAKDALEAAQKKAEENADPERKATYEKAVAQLNIKGKDTTDWDDDAQKFQAKDLTEKETPTETFKNKMKYDLTISKTVDGNMGNKAKDWTFTLTLKDKDGNAITDFEEPENANNWKNNEDGTYTFTLAHGESLTITGLPAGTKYTISEETADGYEQSHVINEIEIGDDGQKTTTKVGEGAASTGEKALGKDTEVDFTNTREMSPPTGIFDSTGPAFAGIGIALLLLAILLIARRRRHA